MLAWCGEHGFDLCLIETMPLGDISGDRTDQYLPLSVVRAACGRTGRWRRPTTAPAAGAVLPREGDGARIGFITPLTHNFCESCNRVRLTCTGHCTCARPGRRRRPAAPAARPALGEAGLRDAILEAIGRKPKGHDFVIDRRRKAPAVARHMSVTGG
jgi:cyclic pyranopterin phosphate synthase